MNGGEVNSGLHRFGQPGSYSLPAYRPATFSAPLLPTRQFAPTGSSAAPIGGLLGGGGPGGNIGAPDPSTNPGLSNAIALGLIGTVLGPAAAFAADAGGIGATASPPGTPDGDGTAGVGIGNGGIGSPGAGTAAGDAAGNTEGSGGPAGDGGGGAGGGK